MSTMLTVMGLFRCPNVTAGSIYKDNICTRTTSVRLNKWLSSTHAELASLQLATNTLKNSGGVIFCDSKSVLQALRNPTCKIDTKNIVTSNKTTLFMQIELDMGIPISAVKAAIFQEIREDRGAVTDTQRPESTSIKSYDMFRTDNYVYGQHETSTRQCNISILSSPAIKQASLVSLFYSSCELSSLDEHFGASHNFSSQQKHPEPVDVINIFKHNWGRIFHPHPPEPTALPNTEVVEDWIHQNRHETTPDDLIHLDNLNSRTELQTPQTPADVKTAVMGTRCRVPGASGIGQTLLRQLPVSIIAAITNLFKASLASGYFPLTLKSATAVLIPKPGKLHTDPKNYSPISRLKTFGKVFERLVNMRLRTHLEDNDLLTNKQFGFRSHRSTHDALNIMTNYISTKDSRLLITKDVEKVFDTLWHDGLKFKLCNNFILPIPLSPPNFFLTT
ncbi:uncharacterized protein [Procambarus clarkii]|uniref:uncharacterized protein n=1 Tax=Procambarus clarkii TaxID=6728 RepID=UPI003742BCEA